MKFKELTTKSDTELQQLLKDLKAEVHEFSVKLRLRQIKNPKALSGKKKDIARVLTYLTQKLSAKQ